MPSNILIQGTLSLMLRLPSERVRGEISLETLLSRTLSPCPITHSMSEVARVREIIKLSAENVDNKCQLMSQLTAVLLHSGKTP
jgi:hypothetical protein